MLTVTCPIYSSFKKNKEAIALQDGERKTNFDELNAKVSSYSKILKSLFLNQGDRIAILSKNCEEMLISIFAAQRLGVTACLLNLQLTEDDWLKQINQANCKLLLGNENLNSLFTKCQLRSLTFNELEQIDASQCEEAAVELDSSRESIIIFTSGSQGHNKGVRLSVGNLLSSAEASNKLTRLTEGDSWAVSLPMYHLGGLGIVYRTLSSGASLTFLEDFSPKSIYDLLSQGKITHLSIVPTILSSLIDSLIENPIKAAFAGSLKCGILAGAASSEILLNNIVKYNIPILSAWGMTETTAHCTCMSLDDSRESVKSVGKPFYHTTLKLVDDNNQEVREGEPGEIIVKGPTVFLGYLDDEQTKNFIKDGWLYTGDLGLILPDGNLKIVDRKDDMIISGGENIHTGEIESIAKKYEGVKDCAVIPVPHPKWGQRPIILVEPKDNHNISEELIAEYLKSNLAKIKVPDQVIIKDNLPRTSIGKVDYKRLKAEYSKT